MPFETLSTETVFRGRALTVRVDRVRLPGGRETSLEIVEHPGSVVIVPVDAGERILFVRQHRHAVGGDLLELPAGTLHPGEDPVVCAGRELREETGQAADELAPLGGFFLAPGYSGEYMHVFAAAGLRVDPLPADEDEDLSLEAIPSADVRRMLAGAAFQDAKSIAALGLFFFRAAPC
jgi:ADP-ribose pyrophosphatase